MVGPLASGALTMEPSGLGASSTTSYTLDFSAAVRSPPLAPDDRAELTDARAELSRVWMELDASVAEICVSTVAAAWVISLDATETLAESSLSATTVVIPKARRATTTSDSSRIDPTTRTCSEVRHCFASRSLSAVSLVSTGFYSSVETLYPTPRTVRTILGFSGSVSIFERSRCT